jgi:hypothetical protein
MTIQPVTAVGVAGAGFGRTSTSSSPRPTARPAARPRYEGTSEIQRIVVARARRG